MALNTNQAITGNVRFSYVHLLKPYARENGEPKYSVTILLPKGDATTKQRIDSAIEAATQTGASKLWGGRPPRVATPVYDGDGVRPSDGQPFGLECKGHWVFTASAKADRPPQVMDAATNPIMQPAEVYSGMYGRAIVSFFPYAVQGKKGVGCGLEAVQKLADGEPLGNTIDAASLFQAAPAQAYTQATAAAQPQIDPITGLPV